MRWSDNYAIRTRRMKSSAIRDLLKVTELKQMISFGGGLPSPESFPLQRFAEASETVIRKHGASALQYGKTEGYTPLRELIAEKASANGIPVSGENVLLTTGSQQALDLIGKIFINRGDCVVIEAPTYIGALQAWDPYEAEYLTLPTDENGMDIDRLEALIQHARPKLIYLLPNFQNPSGVTLSLERRLKLVALAAEHGIPIIEDDPYGRLRYEGEDLPPVIKLAADFQRTGNGYQANVIYLSTFSKILSPGIRLGWILAPEEVIAKLVVAKQGTDLHTSTIVQMIACEVEKDAFLEQHICLIRDLYRARRDAMLSALDRFFPPDVRWTHPKGGLFLWVTFPEGSDTRQLLSRAIERGVTFVPGTPFYPDGRGINQMRLNFSFSSPEIIAEGIARLGAISAEYRVLGAESSLAPG